MARERKAVLMRAVLIDALQKQYEAEISAADATLLN